MQDNLFIELLLGSNANNVWSIAVLYPDKNVQIT